MALNQIKIGGLLSYVSLGVSNALALIYTPFMLRSLGQSEYGLYSLVLSIVSYLSLMDFGFGVALVRYVALYNSQNKSDELPSLYGMFLCLYSIIGVFCFLFGLGLFFFTDSFFGSSLTVLELEKAKVMILIIVIYLSVSFPFSVFGTIITAHEKFIFQKIITIFRAILIPVVMIPLLLMGYKSIAMAVVLTGVGVLLVFINVWFCFSKIKIRISLQNFDFPVLKEIFRFSLFVFAKMIFERIYWSSGQFIIGATVGTISVAIFSVALQMKGYYESFSQAIGNLFLPRLTSMVVNKSSMSLITETFIRVGRIQFHIIGYILCLYLLIGDSFIALWAGNNYFSAYIISLLIMIPYTIPLIQSLGYPIIQAFNVQKFLVLTFFISTLITVGISLLLSKSYGAIGCAIALSIAIVIGEVLLMNWFYWRRLGLDIPLFWKEILKILVPMCVITSLFYFIRLTIKIDSLYVLVLNVGVFSLIYFPYIYFVGMNTYEKELVSSMVRMFKPKK